MGTIISDVEQLALPGAYPVKCAIPECGRVTIHRKPNGMYCSDRCRTEGSRRRRATEEAKKAAGQAKAAEAHAYELKVCRTIARSIARESGTADIERVREAVEEMDLKLNWGAWTGCVFSGPEWEPTGQFVEVRHRGGRRRGGGVRTWRLR